jgi:putative hemolysin
LIQDFLLVLGLIVLNGLFSATEIAVIALRKTRVSQLVESKRPGARAVQLLREQTERFLATVQVGITAVGAAAAVYGEDSLGERLATTLSGIPLLAEWASPLAFAVTIFTITFLSVVIGELVPKSLALRAPEPVALLLARPLLWLSSLARPLVWLLTVSSNLILKLFGDKTSFTETRLSPDELQELVEEAARSGDLDDGTADIASRALDLRDLSAEDVMKPRTQVSALPLGATRQQLLEVLQRELPDRLPLFEGTIDNLAGYVAVKELARQMLDGKPLSLKRLLRPVIYVPPALPAVKLLARMQNERTPLAVVLDEAGGTKGLVAFEDLLEELVGEVNDDNSLPPPVSIVQEPDGSLVVRADTPLRELNRDHGLELPEGEEWSTLAGLCLELAGRIPEPGTLLRADDGSVLEILVADPRVIRSVRVRPQRHG